MRDIESGSSNECIYEVNFALFPIPTSHNPEIFADTIGVRAVGFRVMRSMRRSGIQQENGRFVPLGSAIPGIGGETFSPAPHETNSPISL